MKKRKPGIDSQLQLILIEIKVGERTNNLVPGRHVKRSAYRTVDNADL